MALADYVAVNISASGPGPSAPGFGTGLLAAYHTLGGSRRVMGPYTSLAGVAADGFSTSSPTYLAASKYFGQSPAPSLLYIGRRAYGYAQLVTLTPASTVNGTIYTFNIGAVGGVGGTTVTYTVSGSPSLATLCTALAAAINGSGAGVTSLGTASGVSGTTVVWTTTAANTLVEFQVRCPASTCRVAETRSDAGLGAGLTGDLNAIWAESKAWYGFGLDSNAPSEVAAGAAWAESNGSVIFVASTSDTDAGDSNVTNDVLSGLKTNSYTRTAGLFNQYSNMSYGAFGWLAVHLTQTPGSDTWHFNTIAGVQADTDVLVPEAVVLAVQAKNGSVYTTLANLNLTQGGTTGSGTFMDQTRFIDWQRVDMQLALVALLARNNGKIPFTDAGMALLEQAIKGSLERGVANNGLVPGSYVITVPTVASISAANRLARTVPSLPWTAKLAGAVHKMTINGVASAS